MQIAIASTCLILYIVGLLYLSYLTILFENKETISMKALFLLGMIWTSYLTILVTLIQSTYYNNQIGLWLHNSIQGLMNYSQTINLY